MQKVEFLQNLVADAAQELEYIEKYETAIEDAESNNARYAEIWKMRNPSRQRIRDDLRMIRRITLEVERGL